MEAASCYTRVLLCADFSESAQRVSARAADIARRHQARLHLLHVLEHVPADAVGEFLSPQQVETHERLLREARERLEQLATEMGFPDAVSIVSAGHIRHEIVQHAEELGCDLIVVGSHGRHGLALLLGSTARAILHGATCDVLAVRI